MNTKDDCHDSEKTIETDAGDACLGLSQSHSYIKKDEIIDGNNDVDAELSQKSLKNLVEFYSQDLNKDI